MVLGKMRRVVAVTGLLVGVGNSLLASALFAESSARADFSRDANTCILQISSQSLQMNEWRMARLFGDGRLEIADYNGNDTEHPKLRFEQRLSPDALDIVTADITASGLLSFSEQVARAKEQATGRPAPIVSEAAPTYFKISWTDIASAGKKTEKETRFALTYGGVEARIYPEVQEYQAAQRLILRLLAVSESQCEGCNP